MSVDPKLLELLRKGFMEDLAKQICSVQPMDPNLMKNLFADSRSEQELIADGYQPVSHHRLLWIKPDQLTKDVDTNVETKHNSSNDAGREE